MLTSANAPYRNFLIILLVLGVIIPTVLVGIGVQRITQPIVDLTDAAREITRGG